MTLLLAIQLDVLQLGVHLEAYTNLLPAINTLRLSNRHGQGPHVYITILPPELIMVIEDYILSEEQERLADAWRTDFKCFQLLCDPIDHLTPDQFAEYLTLAERRKIPEDDNTFSMSEHPDDEERIAVHLDFNPDVWRDAHIERSSSWEERVGLPSAEMRGIFTKHSDLIKKHFGLELWVSHVRLEDYPDENYWEMCHNLAPHTTVAYLILPSTGKFKSSSLTEFERDHQEFYVESGYGMSVHVPPPISQSARTRFRRTMQILDLQPWSCSSQDGLDLHAEEGVHDTLDSGTGTPTSTSEVEPQLMILIRHIVRSDEMED
jgi:hypothetical protein